MEKELTLVVDPYRKNIEFYCSMVLVKIDPRHLSQHEHRCSWMIKMDKETWDKSTFEQTSFKENIKDHLKNVHGEEQILDKVISRLFKDMIKQNQ